MAWARLGSFEPVADLNADGLEDLVEPANNGLTAVSGHDGRVLWDGGPTVPIRKPPGALEPGAGDRGQHEGFWRVCRWRRP